MKIAIVRLSALGDAVFSAIFPYLIKRSFPQSHITWVVEEGLEELISASPYVDTIVTTQLKKLKKKFSFSSLIKQKSALHQAGPFDIIFDLQGLVKSAIVARLLGGRVIGYDEKSLREPLATLFYHERFFCDYAENIVLRYASLFDSYFGTHTSKELLSTKPPLFTAVSSPSSVRVCIFVVGASTPQKIWTKENFVALAHELEGEIVAIWGNESEKQSAEWISAQASSVRVSSRLGLKELLSTLNNASLVIGGDTGPVHLAWALNRPSITLFGNTPALRNTYETPINRTIKSLSYVNARHIDKNDFSIRNISPDNVLLLARELLNA